MFVVCSIVRGIMFRSWHANWQEAVVVQQITEYKHGEVCWIVEILD